MTTISTKELADFLEEVNKSTYANKYAPKVAPSRLKSEDYHAERGGLAYHDTYFGGKDFIGEEIVYKNDEPVWGMNYYGYILSQQTDEKELYNFLRQALTQESRDTIPVRGPKSYENNGWKYSNEAEGELGRFTGEEKIHRDTELLYEAKYHGGLIQ